MKNWVKLVLKIAFHNVETGITLIGISLLSGICFIILCNSFLKFLKAF